LHDATRQQNAAHNAPERAGATAPDEQQPIFLARPFWSPFMRIVSTLPAIIGKSDFPLLIIIVTFFT